MQRFTLIISMAEGKLVRRKYDDFAKAKFMFHYLIKQNPKRTISVIDTYENKTVLRHKKI